MASIIPASTVESGADLSGVMGAASRSPRTNAAPPDMPITGNTKAQISPSGRMQNAITALADAAAQLSRDAIWQSAQAISSDISAVAAWRDGPARPATYDISVEQLALPQITSSAAFSSLSTVIGLGTMTIEAGTWSSSRSTFATNPNWPKANITIGPGDNSMERVRDKINAAAIGVIAEVVSDATGSRLVLKSTGTGTSNGFKVSVDSAEPTASAAQQMLSALGFDPSKMGAQGGMSLTQAAQNAKFTVNGEALEAEDNVAETSPDGVTLQLRATTSQPTTVRVQEDASRALQVITTMVQSYNDIKSQLQFSESLPPDLAKKAQSVVETISSALADQAALSDIGLNLTSQNNLELNRDRLAQSLAANPGGVRERLAGATPERGPSLISQLVSRADQDGQRGNNAIGSTQQDSIKDGGAVSFKQRLLEQYRDATAAEPYTLMGAGLPPDSARPIAKNSQ